MIALRRDERTLSTQGIGHFRCPDVDTKRILSNLLVIKISGKLCEPDKLAALAQQVKVISATGKKVIIVHGGGKQIDEALAQAGIKTEKKDGRRVTPPEAMPIICEVMKEINAQIGAALTTVEVATIGSLDFSPIKAKQIFERTGDVESVDTHTLMVLLRRSDVLVLSCIGDKDGEKYNINADDVALALTSALKPQKLILLSDVPGVLLDQDDTSSLVPVVDDLVAAKLVAEARITDGMIPKVQACLSAARSAGEVHLANDNVSVLDIALGRIVPSTKFISAAA